MTQEHVDQIADVVHGVHAITDVYSQTYQTLLSFSGTGSLIPGFHIEAARTMRDGLRDMADLGKITVQHFDIQDNWGGEVPDVLNSQLRPPFLDASLDPKSGIFDVNVVTKPHGMIPLETVSRFLVSEQEALKPSQPIQLP